MSSKGRLLAQAITESRVLSAALTETAETPSTFAVTQKYTTIDDLPAVGNTIGDQAFVESTNRLYIWNGNGWYNIALINTNPSFDSGGAPESSYLLGLNDSGYISPLTITLLATDPEGIPVTYSALVSDSASNFVTVSQDSSVFTITPKSIDSIGEFDSSGGEFSITFRASDGVNLATVLSEFTVDIRTIIENSRYTSLILKTTGVDGATNNTFVDGSTNNFTITRNGNVTQGSFSPYGDKWSNYFDGTGDFLTTPVDAISIGRNDFTYEAWIYPTASPGWGQIIGPAYNTAGIVLFYNSGSLNAYGGGTLLVWSNILQLNVWQHVALTRENDVLYLYHNGVKYGSSAVNTYDLTNSQYRVGANLSGSELFSGYISDVRIIKGTALYTSNFSPPTTPLTAVSGTELLTCQSNRFKDNSTNDFTITPNGDVKVTKFSPYDNDAFDLATNGGSGYFDGTNDYLSFSPSSTSIENWYSDNYTIEMYVYPKSHTQSSGSSNGGLYLSNGVYNTSVSYWSVGTSDTGYLTWYYFNGSPILIASTTNPLSTNTWNHVAISYIHSSGLIKGYVNGIEVFSVAKAGTPQSSSSTNLNIGVAQNTYFDGYISDLRVVKGTALYTSNFTPPTEPLTPVANTSLLCNFTNAGIYDASTKNVLETVGNAQVDTAVTKFGTGSMEFNGVDDYLLAPPSDQFNFGTGDFTIEFWAYRRNVRSAWHDLVVAAREGTFSTGEWGAGIYPQVNGALYFDARTGSGDVDLNGGNTTENAWNHIAIVRNGSLFTGYINGIAVDTHTSSEPIGLSTQRLSVGAFGDGSHPFDGYIEDLRITKGLARYTSNFTPPVGPLDG